MDFQFLKSKKWQIMGAVLLAILSAALRLEAFRQTNFANGWDAYFYLIQLRAWLETGRMHSPEASLIYPFFIPFYWFSGDYVAAFKIGSAALAGVFTLAVFFFFFEKNWRWAFVAAAWTVASPHLTWFAAQFPKNLLGVSLLLFFIQTFSKFGSSAGEKLVLKKFLLPALLLILNFFGHRMTFGLAMVWLVFGLIFQFGKNLLPHFFFKKLAAGLAAAAIFFLAAGKFFPGLFHVSDFERLGGWLRRLHFTPYLFVENFGAGGRLSIFWKVEVAAAVVFFIFSSLKIVFQRGSDASQIATVLLAGLLLFPFGEWSLTSFSFRFVAVFVLLAPVFSDFELKKWSAALATSLLIFTSFWTWKSYSPAKFDPNYPFFEKITRAAQQNFPTEKPELVIAHNALAEIFTFSTHTDAMPWLPEYPIDSSRLWRIAADIRQPEIEYFLEENDLKKVARLSGEYFFMPEFLWQKILKKARAESDQDFLERAVGWKNPSKTRPQFLLRRKMRTK